MPSAAASATHASAAGGQRTGADARRVSLLSPAAPLQFSSEADALARLQPGIDGVILECAGRRATFPPQVWGATARTTDIHCPPQAEGRPSGGFWDPQMQLAIYHVEVKEHERCTTEDPESRHPGRWWHALADGRIQCDLCPRDCKLHEGQREPASCA